MGDVHRPGIPATRRSSASGRFAIQSSGIRAIREQTSLSQAEFALLIGVSVKAIQNWEQARRQPSGPAVALLKIIANEPRLAVEAIHRPERAHPGVSAA